LASELLIIQTIYAALGGTTGTEEILNPKIAAVPENQKGDSPPNKARVTQSGV